MTEKHGKKSIIGKIIRILLPLVLIAGGGAAMAYFKATAPVIDRKPPQRQVTVVQVQSIERKDTATAVSAMGTVVAAREVTLKSRVSGEVRFVASQFVPGGIVKKDEKLLSLDPADHQLAVQKARSALEEAKAALAIEQGSQTIAREELRLLSELSANTQSGTDLALRKPQLQQAQAAVSSAEADLRIARLDLERTVIRAPFNAMILERNVNVGASVGVQESLATIVGTDEFWVEAVVPMDQLARIDFNRDGGCPATVRSQSGDGSRSGQVVRIVGKLNETSRMATVIIAVSDPFKLQTEGAADRMMIDDYVFVEMAGRTIANVVELPRAVLQDGQTVWINDGGKLDIRPVTLAWKDNEKVYIQNGIESGEQVIVSDLSTPVQGMPLKVAGMKADGVAVAEKAEGAAQ